MYRGMAAVLALATLLLAPGTRFAPAAPFALDSDAPVPVDAQAIRFVLAATMSGSGPVFLPSSEPDVAPDKPAPAAMPKVLMTTPPAASQPASAPQPEPTSAPPQSIVEPTVVAPLLSAASSPTCAGAPTSTWAAMLLEALNNERTSRGVPVLAVDACAAQVASMRATDLASRGYFSHTSPDGTTAGTLLSGLGLDDVVSAENLAMNNYLAEESVAVAIRDLMASDAHRRAILRTEYTHVGVASADSGSGMRYFAIVFLVR